MRNIRTQLFLWCVHFIAASQDALVTKFQDRIANLTLPASAKTVFDEELEKLQVRAWTSPVCTHVAVVHRAHYASMLSRGCPHFAGAGTE